MADLYCTSFLCFTSFLGFFLFYVLLAGRSEFAVGLANTTLRSDDIHRKHCTSFLALLQKMCALGILYLKRDALCVD